MKKTWGGGGAKSRPQEAEEAGLAMFEGLKRTDDVKM